MSKKIENPNQEIKMTKMEILTSNSTIYDMNIMLDGFNNKLNTNKERPITENRDIGLCLGKRQKSHNDLNRGR